MELQPVLVDLLQRAYSAEKAAAFAYRGQAGSVRDAQEKAAIRQIEEDEWNHRREVLRIMERHGIPASRYYEFRCHLVGRAIAASCFLLGRFMPNYFAGRLESGNVCEYFRMRQQFNELGISDHDKVLYDMGMKEKEHEVYFLGRIESNRRLPFFERVFSWGRNQSFNNVDLEDPRPPHDSADYCATGSAAEELPVPPRP